MANILPIFSPHFSRCRPRENRLKAHGTRCPININTTLGVPRAALLNTPSSRYRPVVSETHEADVIDAGPTARDRENARVRSEIAARQQAEYDACLAWALDAFGSGWLPSHRHFLASKHEEERVRHTGERPQAAATVYTVKNPSGQARHFTLADGRVVEHDSYEAGFGPMLLEPHPTRGFEHRGQFCRTHRYSLCFAPYAVYAPKTAEQLAALRATRERKRSEREDERWAEEYPLFATAGFKRQDG